MLETSRLILREFIVDDAEALYNLNGDPDVIRFTGDVPFKEVLDAVEFIATYDEYRTNGCGRWAMIGKSAALENQFVGWCGLKFHPESGETDVGFRLSKAYWNRGLATEAAQACIEHGFMTLRLKSIIGRAMAANTASISVLEKIGMRFERPFEFHGGPGVIYRICNPRSVR